MSPEQLENKLTLKSDIWAFGCVLLELATGLKPYAEITDSLPQLLKVISLDMLNPLEYCLKNYRKEYDIIIQNPELRYLLNQCFNFNYISRPGASDIAADSFFDLT